MHKASAATPRLYHAPSSYYSMIARLALAEGGIAYEPVFMEIHVRMMTTKPPPLALKSLMFLARFGIDPRLSPASATPTLSRAY